MAQFKRLFWDIEVSPNIVLAWRAGWKQTIPPENIIHERAIICICYKWQHEKTVHSLTWDAKQNDKKMLKTFVKVLNGADEAVAHNGDKYDIKMFNGRCLFHKLRAPKIVKTLDTLVIARRRFALNSNKLDYIAQYMGMEGKTKTEYSWWEKVLMDNCQVTLRKMVRYCKKDVILGENVFLEISAYHNCKTHIGVWDGHEKWHCPECGSGYVIKRRERITQAGTVSHDLSCKKCDRWYMVNNKVFNDMMEAREKQGNKVKPGRKKGQKTRKNKKRK